MIILKESNFSKFSKLETEIKNVVKKVMTSPSFGFDESEISDYSKVDIGEVDNGMVKVEIRADVSYRGLVKLSHALDPIVVKYDKDAYFDAEAPGIINAYINSYNF
jgi:hypothetical protein